ncbi:MAG: Na(+)-translocating NADH-quinone reductase subunit C [Alphaproteobacteria bacterium]|nr:Na(+)-translocating NADH-quinone reductase subunit C [Alphaproteobacteria bacterium]
MDLPNDHPVKTLVVTLLVALVCSALVTGAAIGLKPYQIANKEAARQSQILDIIHRLPGAADDLKAGRLLLQAHIVDLATGDYVPDMDPALYDQRRAARDVSASIEIPIKQDVAWIKRRAKYATVYLLLDGTRPRLVVLPVHGKGYGSTLYGYLGVTPDLKMVIGLNFYEHTETPGLGSLIDAPAWRQQWFGKKIWDQGDTLRLGIADGPVDPASPDAAYQVDALTGATWTSHGVTNLLRYWLGNNGFKPYLDKLRGRS